MSNWIKTTDQLPPERKYVIGRYHARNWGDNDDPENAGVVIVKLIKGLSKQERENLPDSDVRKFTFKAGDEDSNNLVPYIWATFGASKFFGQDIIEWKFID